MKVKIQEALVHLQDTCNELAEDQEEHLANEENREYPNDERMERYEERKDVLEEASDNVDEILHGYNSGEFPEKFKIEFEWKKRALPKTVDGLIELVDVIGFALTDVRDELFFKNDNVDEIAVFEELVGGIAGISDVLQGYSMC